MIPRSKYENSSKGVRGKYIAHGRTQFMTSCHADIRHLQLSFYYYSTVMILLDFVGSVTGFVQNTESVGFLYGRIVILRECEFCIRNNYFTFP